MLAFAPRSLWRHLAGPVIASIAFLLLDPQAAWAAPDDDVPVPPSELLLEGGDGAVTPADADFVVKVRLAGLWEIPAGEMAQEKSDDNRIKQIGRNIAAQHEVLDQLTRNAAKELDVKLPNKPNSDQQGWLAEMEESEGEEFDQVYIDRLRAAHGKIFPAIATIRASTRNDVVRKLAQQANQFVMTHMTLLESSEIVDFQSLPTAPNPSAAASSKPAASGGGVSATRVSQSQPASTNTPLIVAALVGGLAVGIFATKRFAGSTRRRGYRPRRY